MWRLELKAAMHLSRTITHFLVFACCSCVVETTVRSNLSHQQVETTQQRYTVYFNMTKLKPFVSEAPGSDAKINAASFELISKSGMKWNLRK